MTTHQSIREMSFEKSKAIFGGYEMTAVDDFLEVVANDFEALQKENLALKSKMKILVEKIEEYRANEDALNRSILSAQKLSVQIESDARARAQAIISEAETKAASVLGGIDDKILLEESRLQAAKISSAKFLESVRELCKKQLANIEMVSTAASLPIEKEEVRIPAEKIAPVPEPSAVDSGNTQIFSFKEE